MTRQRRHIRKVRKTNKRFWAGREYTPTEYTAMLKHEDAKFNRRLKGKCKPVTYPQLTIPKLWRLQSSVMLRPSTKQKLQDGSVFRSTTTPPMISLWSYKYMAHINAWLDMEKSNYVVKYTVRDGGKKEFIVKDYGALIKKIQELMKRRGY